MSQKTPQPIAQRRIPIWVVIVLILTALVLATTAYYFLKPLEGPIPADAGSAYLDLQHSTTADGFPRLGRADAPIVITDFSSYACPHCREFHEDRFPTLLPEIAAGNVQFIMIPVPHIGPGAEGAARAALCAAEQDQFWTMHDVLYHWQAEFLTRTFDPKRLKKGAENMGLDVDAFATCLDADRTTTLISAARAAFAAAELTGTPSFFINGQVVIDYAEFENLGRFLSPEGDS